MESWKDRLWLSRKEGVGFAAPGGEFTRAFGQWLMTEEGAPVRRALQNTPLVELGAGMYHFGYELAALTGCKSYTGVEPFYGGCLEAAIKTFKSEIFLMGQYLLLRKTRSKSTFHLNQAQLAALWNSRYCSIRLVQLVLSPFTVIL